MVVLESEGDDIKQLSTEDDKPESKAVKFLSLESILLQRFIYYRIFSKKKVIYGHIS